jgi:hypothetical protein
MVRFTAWVSVAERAAIKSRARELNTSANYVVRMAVRDSLGLTVQPDVTLVTGNDGETT